MELTGVGLPKHLPEIEGVLDGGPSLGLECELDGCIAVNRGELMGVRMYSSATQKTHLVKVPGDHELNSPEELILIFLAKKTGELLQLVEIVSIDHGHCGPVEVVIGAQDIQSCRPSSMRRTLTSSHLFNLWRIRVTFPTIWVTVAWPRLTPANECKVTPRMLQAATPVAAVTTTSAGVGEV